MKKAVITGDVVHSTSLSSRKKLLRSMKYVFGILEEQRLIKKGYWTVFKGDSFQLITIPERAFSTMLILRSAFRGGIYRFASPLVLDEMLPETFDVRLSCGIGTVETIPKRINEAYGEAFIISGKMLDRISEIDLRLLLTTKDRQLNDHFEMACRMADLLVKDWTNRSAQAICRQLLYSETQVASAAFFGISQSSVQHRLKIGHYDEIRYLLTYFERQIPAYIQKS
jgi:hypothetical protein